MENIERIGSYPAIVINDNLYKITDIENLTEVDIESWVKNNPNYCALGLRNLDDSSKCKIITISSRKRAYDSWKKWKENEFVIVI